MTTTEELIAELAGEMLDSEPELAELMDLEIFAAAPALAADPTLAAETSASNRANLRRWLTAVRAHPEAAVAGDPPPEALDVAVSLTRRGIETGPLLSAYRAGQNLAWAEWMRLASERITDRGELIAVLERSSTLISAYVDRVIDAILAHVQREREAMLGGEPIRRAETVRLILDGAPLTAATGSSRLGYELDRPHTALVVWAEERGLEPGELERAATAIAQAGGAGRPLMMPAGASVLWAWIGGGERGPDREAMRAAMAELDPRLRVAVGPTRAGITGFRRSHTAAIDAQRILAGSATADGGEERMVSWEDVQVVALAGRDPEAGREFADSVLGGLAAEGESAARLRETARVYLEEGSNAPRAAERLHLHRNTVLYRVGKAEELLGRPLGQRRLAVMLALELRRRLG